MKSKNIEVSTLTITNSSGEPAVVLGVDSLEKPFISLLEKRQEVLSLKIMDCGTPYLKMVGKSCSGITLGLKEDKAFVSFMEKEGQPALRISIGDCSENNYIDIYNNGEIVDTHEW